MVKFSVKKPLTVFVAVIAVVVLGIVAFTNMTPDLLPNIDMPYIVVITAYPGASPEKVETSITRPMEQSMATLEHIVQVDSTSSENASIIMLEFDADVNMDTITVDILQRINQLQPGWDDMVGAPTILKLNPSMLPVMVAAVDMEGMSTRELSQFLDQELLPKLEGTTGVASITASGVLEEKIHVMLNQEKIDAVNEKVAAAVAKEVDEKAGELEDTKAELEDAKAEADSGQSKLDSGKQTAVDKIAETRAQLLEKQAQLHDGRTQLQVQRNALVAQQNELVANIALLEKDPAVLDAYEDVSLALEDNNNATAFGKYLAFRASGMTHDQALAALDSVEQSQAGVVIAALNAAGISYENVSDPLATMAEIKLELISGAADKNNREMLIASLGLGSEAEVQMALPQMRSGLDQLKAGLATIDSTLTQLNDGEKQLLAGLAELERQASLGTLELSEATTQLLLGQSTLESALKQVESGIEQVADAKEDALKQADLHTVLTKEMISQILAAQNFSMPAGYVSSDGVQMLVSVGEDIASMDELAGLMLMDMGMDGLDPIYLTDVADVYMSDNANSIYAKVNGRDGVLLSFSKQSTYATAAVSDNLQARFDQLSQEYEGLRFHSMMDQGDYIYIVVNSIIENLLLGALFAIIILFLFLKDIRPTLITLLSIPISVIFALALMYFSGVTLNIISLSGLAVAVGMLVDNSVVVIENTYRLRAMGVSAVKAAVSGAAQVAGAIASSTLTTVCVFLPIVFVEGITRDLFTDMALTMGYSLVASLIVALTLVPAMASKMLVNAKPKEDKLLSKMLVGYQKAVRWALRRKVLVLVVTVGLLVASIGLVLVRGFTFMPSMSMPQLTVSVTMPEETEFADATEMTDEVLARIDGIDGVETTGAMIGGSNILGMLGGGGGSTGDTVESATIYVLLDADAQDQGARIGNEINEVCADMPCEVSASSASGMSMDMLTGSGLSVNLYSNDLQDLQNAARDVARVLEGVPGTADVNDGIGDTNPEIRFVVDKEKAMVEGLTTAQVYMELSKVLSTETVSTTLLYDGNEYEVRILKGDQSELTADYIKNYRFTVTNQAGEEHDVLLRSIADIEETESRTSISRTDQRRYVTVTAGVAEGHNVSLVTTDAQSALKGYPLPAGVTMEFSGENESIMDAFRELINMLLLGVLLVYLIMVAQFQSLKSPFIVMFTIPLAFTGGMLALLITGLELSVISLIGFVMLVGIIVNNGIVLVDYINQLRLTGMERREAIVEAGVTRMRPILMTTITTILGLIVMALGRGTGSELMQPIAIVCIGGLTYATLLTLFVVPIMYDLLNRKELKAIQEDDLMVVEE